MKVIVGFLHSIAITLTGALAIAAPTSADDRPFTPYGLAGTSWRFIDIVSVGSPNSVEATLNLSVDGAVAGFSGCNQFFGHYTVNGENLSFSDIGSTKMWCRPEIMVVEFGVKAVLSRTSRMATNPVELTLLDSGGAVLARLAPATPN